MVVSVDCSAGVGVKMHLGTSIAGIRPLTCVDGQTLFVHTAFVCAAYIC